MPEPAPPLHALPDCAPGEADVCESWPAGRDGWLAAVPAEVALAYFAAETEAESAAVAAVAAAAIARAVPAPGDLIQPGGLSRPGGRAGAGFAAGGVADDLAPGVVLAGLTEAAWERRDLVSDDELIGITRAWRRLASWAQAAELAAVSELVTRRDAQVTAGADPHIAEHVSDELAIALTLTSRSADQLVSFATGLDRLPATRAALLGGDIDWGKAWVIYESTIGLAPAHATTVESAVLGNAARQTTGQLRAACQRAVLAADPAAASRRREEAQKEARVETWSEPAGTAALAGRDLPPADVLAADRRIDSLARQLKSAGAPGGLDVLRARVYTALLLGIPLQALHSQLCPATKPVTTQPDVSRSDTTGPGTTRPPGPGATEPGAPGPGTTGPGTIAASSPAAGSWSGDFPAAGLRTRGSLAAGSPTPDSPGTSAPGSGIPHTDAPGAGPPGAGSPSADRAWSAFPGADHACTCSRSAGSACMGSPRTGPDVSAAALVTSSALPLAGSVHLTMPLSTWLGGAAPAEAAGFGSIPASDARDLSRVLAAQPSTQWCLTLTGADGTPLAHGCARLGFGSRRSHGTGSHPMPELTVTIKPLAVGNCRHEHETAGYQPSQRLRHLVTIRQRRCTAPGCRRAAQQCDLDHTIPHDQGGRTCECDLAPLCRRHHRAKQTHGWWLEQPEPGTMVWTLPHGRSYRTGPEPYPADGP